MSWFISYMFRLLPNNTYPAAATYAACQAQREMALGDVERIVFLDPANIQKILSLIQSENDTLSNAFQGWKQCSAWVITSTIDLLKGSICWYRYLDNQLRTPESNFPQGNCIHSISSRPLRNISCNPYGSDLSDCFGPFDNYTALSYSHNTPTRPNGLCNTAFEFIDQTISVIFHNTTKNLRHLFSNLTDTINVGYTSQVNCTALPISSPKTINNDDSDPNFSTTTIVIVSVASTILLAVTGFGVYKLLTKRSANVKTPTKQEKVKTPTTKMLLRPGEY